MNNISAIILAAGEGKRMKSKYSKVLHKVCDKPMVECVYDTVKDAGIQEVVLVVGHKAEQVKEYMGNKASYALQEQQLGTGHAVMQTQKNFEGKDGYVIVLCGDTPLITEETIKGCIDYHINGKYSATVITAELADPTGYGRIIRDSNGNVLKIVEQKDANEEEKKVKEINSGMYCFTVKDLFTSLENVNNNNVQGEYYLTDTLEILIKEGKTVGALIVKDSAEIMGVNSRIQLSQAESIMRERILHKHMSQGVTIIDPGSTYISYDTMIGMDTIIYPGTIIRGKTLIGEDCIIGPNTTVFDSNILNGAVVEDSFIEESKIGENTKVGPFAHLRPNSMVGRDVKIGNFVEIKNSTVGDETKVAHLSYVGDAQVGSGVNIGCGAVVVNYDGKEKHKTIIEDNCFIGCNTNLISPVILRNNCYTAAGSTITDEVPQNALGIARCRQTNIEGWVLKKRK